MENESWAPSASIEVLRSRAEMLRGIREYFHARGVMEVDTPALSGHGTVDRFIDSYAVPGAGWLHTSPEFAMKRLLAAGSGPIYQLCHVFRSEPAAVLHNPEFMMLEWYRPGWDHHRLMDEVAELVAAVVADAPACGRCTYFDAFKRFAGLDPFLAPLTELQEGLGRHRVALPTDVSGEDAQDRDFWLDLWMGAVVGPTLGHDRPIMVHDFPASQCAMAKVRDGIPPVAERFELFWHGVELANGFHELTDPDEQARRFAADSAWRRRHARPTPPPDQNLLAALAAGMPEGAGVALGVDRLLAGVLGATSIADCMAFDTQRA